MKHLDNQIIVSIKCLVYNHAPYIRQCLDGFVMQKTNFRFEAIVHDDASTDGTQDIIREYEKKYPDIIKPIYEVENQYRKGTLRAIMDNAVSESSKYIAICEGDDYWTDPYKLQKQVDFLEGHSEYTMTCHRVKCFSESDQKFIREDYCYEKSQDIRVKDIIYRTGLFIPTCSIIYRKEVKDNYPDYCTKCLVGDYPLQIMCAMKGKTYYFNDLMGIYRVNNNNSWMGKQVWRKFSKERVEVIRSQLNMFKGFAKDYPQWEKQFHNKEVDHILRFMPSKIGVSQEDYKKYVEEFVEEINKFTLLEKLDMKIRMCNNQYVKSLYRKIYLKQFHTKKKYI